MSDDLTKELRSYPRHYEAAHKAADELDRLDQIFLEFIRTVNECETVCAVGSPCLCAVEHRMWVEKE